MRLRVGALVFGLAAGVFAAAPTYADHEPAYVVPGRPDVPVYVVHQSGHIGVANSKALEILGITADTPNPLGGVIERRPGSQEPNGVLQENVNFGALPKLFAHLDPNGAKELLKAGIAGASGGTSPAI